MNFSREHWRDVEPKQFQRLLAASNPLRENWSNGELLYEFRGTERHMLGFVAFNGSCRVPDEIWEAYFDSGSA